LGQGVAGQLAVASLNSKNQDLRPY